MNRFFLLVTILLSSFISYGQATEDLAIELTGQVQEVPAKITLHWKLLTVDTPTYIVYRKTKTATSWGSAIASLPATIDSYVDNSVVVDSAYEYQVWGQGTYLQSYGYIFAGIKSQPLHNKGTMLLLVDTTFTDSCKTDIHTLMSDLWGDGWQLIRHDIGRTPADTAVKAMIAYDYAHNTNVKSVLIVGHVAVPYSGDFSASGDYPPDGHVPFHDGAWPSDIYYSCMTGWTDATVTNTLGSYTPNWNVPGDNKFDQIFLPSPAVLQIGRIDFNDMPSFSASEFNLMRSYLAKDHAYKMDSIVMHHRAIMHDDFGYFSGEGFAANGWRNFSPLITNDSLLVVGGSALIQTLADSTFQWAYGCGGGSFTSAGGIGSTSDYVINGQNNIFTMMFGSYFGDWNVTDNFLRAPLCANPPALTNCWAGRPNWFFHHMALGENIGYGALLSQNNMSLYQPTGYGNDWIHAALMGDLSLRTDYIKPITSLTIATPVHAGANLSWTASPDTAVHGYFVYRADSVYGYFQLLNTTAVTTTTYHDATGHSGKKYYMVRPVKLKATPSGTYYDLGVGVTDTATVSFASALGVASVAPGIKLAVYPNPAQGYLNVTVHSESPCVARMYIVNVAGEQLDLVTKQLNTGDNTYTLNVSRMPPGLYSVVVSTGANISVQKWVKL
jgi:type IX secretion system substrate protein